MKTNVTLIANAVAAFNKYESATLEFNESRVAMGKTMSAILPPGIPYVEYVEVSTEWKVKYGSTEGAANTAWSRAIDHMNGYLASIKAETFTIPKSENPESAKRQAKREAEKKEVEAKALALLKSLENAPKKERDAFNERVAMGDKVARRAADIRNEGQKAILTTKNETMYKAITAELRKHKTDTNLLQQFADLLRIKP